MPKTNKAKRRPDHTKMSAEERIRNFRLIDDMFFGAVMNNDIELTEKILEIVLGKKIHIVSAHKKQRLGRPLWACIRVLS